MNQPPMTENSKWVHTLRVRRTEWLNERELITVVDGKHVILGQLLDAIPPEVLRDAAAGLEAVDW
jgi:hypothetical protein